MIRVINRLKRHGIGVQLYSEKEYFGPTSLGLGGLLYGQLDEILYQLANVDDVHIYNMVLNRSRFLASTETATRAKEVLATHHPNIDIQPMDQLI